MTRVIDKTLRMSVTLGDEAAAPAESGQTAAKKPDFWKTFVGSDMWKALAGITADEPVDELTAAYRKLCEEQVNCHMTVIREDVLTYRTTLTQYDYDYDGHYVRAVYSGSGDLRRRSTTSGMTPAKRNTA